MKKLVTAACALVAGLALADGGVQSANTVGYANLAAPRNSFIALGVQFVDPLTYEVRTVAINDLVETTNPRTGTSMNNNVDQIHVWTGSAWKKYYNRTGVGYVDSEAADTSVPTTDTVSAGDGVFFRKGNFNKDGVVTISGAVYTGDSVTYALPRNAFTFISYPWPIAFSINDFATIITNPRTGTALNNNVDQIHVWTGSAWKKYYNRTGVGYVDSEAADTSAPTTDTIAPGVCVFVRKGNFNKDGSLTFAKPSNID